MIPGLDTKTGEWSKTPYNTSFMNEWNRMGVEPTFTFTSAGGPGGGFRTYFPYSDPLGVGWEFDLDPTGPGTGILLNTGALREWSNSLADRIGDNSVGNSFRDLNLPPGFLYAGVEVAGNVPAPFVGATVTLDDTENLEHWLQLPENEGKSNFSRAFMHGMGPGLHAWNMPSKLSGQMTINNPLNVMGDPLWKSPDLFGGRKIHNPFSGTRIGLGGRSGLKGGNVIPNLEIAGKQILSLEGGFAAIKEEVTELAEDLMKKNKNLSHSQAMKKAYSETAGSINVGKVFEKLKIPKVLDYAGELVYGAPGSGVTAPYQKSGNTLANYLKNSKFNYGKFINNPWFWKTIARGLMVPDIMNTVTGALHQKGQPISDAWEGVFGEDKRNFAMEKYGAFPRMQRWWNEGIDPVFGAKWWKSEDEEHDDNMTKMNQLYEEYFIEKYNVTKDEIYDKEIELQKKNNWEYDHDPALLKKAEKNAPAEVKKEEKIIKKAKAKEYNIKRTEMHIKNPYLAPKYQTGGEPESLTSLRRFTEELPTEIGYNEEDILNQKLSLAQMKNGGSNICPICGKLKSQCGCNYKMGGDLPKAQTGLTDSYIPSITEGVNISGSNTGDYKLSGNQPLYYDCGEGTGSRCSYRTPPFMGTINPFQFEFGYNPEGGDANAALKATAGLRLGTSTSGSGGSGIEGNLNITGGLRAYTNLLEENPELNMGALANITGNLGYFENNWQDKWRTNFGGYANYDLLNKDLTVGPYLQTGPFRFSGNYNPVTNDWGANIGLGINLSNREQKYGGEQVDIDEQLLQELITAGADIEIL